MWAVLLIIALVLTSVAVYYCYLSYNDDDDTIVCHLCEEPVKLVKLEDWMNHRKDCADRNKARLAAIPVAYDVLCPKCHRPMKQWPASLNLQVEGPTFICRGELCPRKNELLLSNGNNRYGCFLCNYNLCQKCAHTDAQLHKQSWTQHMESKEDDPIWVQRSDVLLV